MSFIEELKALCEKHSMRLIGEALIVTDQDIESLDIKIFNKPINNGGIIDHTRQYLSFDVNFKKEDAFEYEVSVSGQIIDREKLMNGGVKSMADGKHYTSRAKYETSLKDQGYVLMGNDQGKNPKAKTAEYDKIVTKRDISEAYDKVKSKYGLRD